MLRDEGGEDAVKIRCARPERDQREHVEAAMHDGLPASNEERQPAPQDYRCGQRELNPRPNRRREHVLHGH